MYIQQQLAGVHQLNEFLNFMFADIACIKNIFPKTDGITNVFYTLKNDTAVLVEYAGDLASDSI